MVPETRELGQLLRMLEERGADTVPCPMIAIRDAPDPVPINAWLRCFAKGTCNDLVLMTGEGLRRLLGFARRLDMEHAFRVALKIRIVTSHATLTFGSELEGAYGQSHDSKHLTFRTSPKET